MNKSTQAKKFLSLLMVFTFAFNSSVVFAAERGKESNILNGSVEGKILAEIGKRGLDYSELGAKYLWKKYQCKQIIKKREKYKGFKPLNESKELLNDVVNGKSEDKVYGQELAKKQCLPILKQSIHNIETLNSGRKTSFNVEGNVIYMIGPSGVGKSTMAKAIANAVLKYPEKTLLVINTGAIDGEEPLGSQLFKTIEKKNIGFENRSVSDFNEGIYTIETESPILDHILRWQEAVVIIDDYDKMKKMTRKDYELDYDNDLAKEDRTADEIIKAIADTGKYRVFNTEIDCSKILFIITTNETREELEKNFGIDGVKGGGVQRLNIIEFNELTHDDCRKIIDEIIEKLKEEITDFKGSFKLFDFYIDDKSKEKLAKLISNDKVNQGRLKRRIKNELMALFTENIGDEAGKSFDVVYTESSIPGAFGKLEKFDHEGDENCGIESCSNVSYEISSDDNFCKTVVYDINDCCNNIRADILYGDFSCTRDTEVYSKLNAYFSTNTVKVLKKYKRLRPIISFVMKAVDNRKLTSNAYLRQSFAENLLRSVLSNFLAQLNSEKWRENDIVNVSFLNDHTSVTFKRLTHEDCTDSFNTYSAHLKVLRKRKFDKDKTFKSIRSDVARLLSEI